MMYYTTGHKLGRATPGSAGFDLRVDTLVEGGGNTATVGTGVFPIIPTGMVGLVFERSSLHKQGWGLVNSVGVIDSDYRGEIMLKLRSETAHSPLEKGARIAQLVVVPCFIGQPHRVDAAGFAKYTTRRGNGGFGSTGEQ